MFLSAADERRNWHAILARDSSAFWSLIDSAYGCILRSLYVLSVVRYGNAPCRASVKPSEIERGS